MNIKQILFLSVLLPLTLHAPAPDFITEMTTATTNLQTTTNALNAIINSGAVVPAPARPRVFTYKNTTNIAIILSLSVETKIGQTSNVIEYQQEILPGATYSQTINTEAELILEAEANLSGIYQTFNPAASYSIVIDEATKQLKCTQTDLDKNTITNNSSWPMLITSTIDPDGKNDLDYRYIELKSGDKFNPNTLADNIMITPLIVNKKTKERTVASCEISISGGEFSFKFV